MLYDYQRVGIEFLKQNPHALLADDRGLGKTIEAIVALKESGARRVLIVCPKTAKLQWKDELGSWWPEKTVGVISGAQARRDKTWTAPYDVHIVGLDCLRIDSEQEAVPWSWYDAIVIDEAHRLKNRNAKTVKALRLPISKKSIIFLLTGTPITNHPENLWSLLRILDPKAHSSYWRFVKYYCDVFDAGFALIIGAVVKPNELRDHISKYAIRREKSLLVERGELPEKIVQPIRLELDPQHKKQYVQLAKEFVVRLASGEIKTAVNVVSNLAYLRQAAIHPTLLDPEYDGEPLEGPKMDLLLDLLEDAELPIVTFSHSRKAVIRAALALEQRDISHAVIHGGVSEKGRAEAQRMYQAGTVRVLLGTIGAMGESLNLVEGDTGFFLSKDWNDSSNVQAQDRLHRIGQKNTVHIVEALSAGTIDERIQKLNAKKRAVSELLLGGLTHEELIYLSGADEDDFTV